MNCYNNSYRASPLTDSNYISIRLKFQGGQGNSPFSDDNKILIVTEKGYGKQTYVREFRETSRGSKGVKALNITDKNGNIAAVKVVDENKELVIMTNTGTTIRMTLDQINTLGRVTQGVRLIHLKDDQYVTTISLVDKEEIIDESDSSEITE